MRARRIQRRHRPLTLSPSSLMEPQIMEIVFVIVVLLVLLDLAAMRWGTDTRDGFRAARR